MRRVVLHLGVHRTGMRGLQDRLFAQRAALARAGVLYPDLGQNHAHHALAAAWMTLPGLSEEHFGPEGAEAPWRRLRAELAAAPQADVFLSAEAFSRAGPQPVDMPALAARLRALGDAVQVVLTVRAQASLLPALWLELARHQVPPAPGPFIARALRDHVAAGVWLDFNRLYDHLLQGFAPDEITVLDHDTLHAAPGGAWAALLQIAAPERMAELAGLGGGDGPPSDTDPDPTGDAGHPLAVLAAARICAPAPPRAELALRIAAGLGRATPGGFASQLLTRAEDRALDAVFAPLNAAFQARVRQVQPGFTLASPPLPDPAALWREDMTADLWASIAADLVRRARAVERLTDPPPPNLPKRIWRRILDICLG